MARYKVLKDLTPVGANLYPIGAIVNFDGWPKGAMAHGLEPVDDDARRITDYYKRKHMQPGLPASPYASQFGCFLLPALLPNVRGKEVIGFVRETTSRMPRYTADQRIEVSSSHVIEPDVVFTFVGWPPSHFVPANDQAQRVVEYLREHSGHPMLPWCPFNEYDDNVFLPSLPKITGAHAPGYVNDGVHLPQPRARRGSGDEGRPAR